MDNATSMTEDEFIVELLRAGKNLGIWEVNDDELTFLGVLTLDDE